MSGLFHHPFQDSSKISAFWFSHHFLNNYELLFPLYHIKLYEYKNYILYKNRIVLLTVFIVIKLHSRICPVFIKFYQKLVFNTNN